MLIKNKTKRTFAASTLNTKLQSHTKSIKIHLFWERGADIETSQKFSSHTGVIYKLVLDSVKSLNTIFEVIEY